MAVETQTRFPRNAVAITKSDTTRFGRPMTVYVGTAGTVAVKPWDNHATTVTFVGLLAGSVIPLQVVAVMSTSTTADNFVGVFD